MVNFFPEVFPYGSTTAEKTRKKEMKVLTEVITLPIQSK